MVAPAPECRPLLIFPWDVGLAPGLDRQEAKLLERHLTAVNRVLLFSLRQSSGANAVAWLHLVVTPAPERRPLCIFPRDVRLAPGLDRQKPQLLERLVPFGPGDIEDEPDLIGKEFQFKKIWQ